MKKKKAFIFFALFLIATMDELPPELVKEILQYIDIKQLATLLLVSQTWNAIVKSICDDLFRNLGLDKILATPNKLKLLINSRTLLEPLPEIDLSNNCISAELEWKYGELNSTVAPPANLQLLEQAIEASSTGFTI
jgi:hypothetical protein